MDANFIFQQVQKMQPSSFSEEERLRYKAEKMMLRQFMLMKQQDQVPEYLTIRKMKTWLMNGRSFLQEFHEVIETTGINPLFNAELAWVTTRVFCLSQMEEELQEELDKEMQLSQQLGRTVTMEGLNMLLSLVRPEAEESVHALLAYLQRKLPKIFSDIEAPRDPLCAGPAKPEDLLQLQQSSASLVSEVVDTAIKFLLEEPWLNNKHEAVSAKISKLLADSATPRLSQLSISETFLFGICTAAARFMVNAIYMKFDKHIQTFKLISFDESFHSAREGVISAIQGMEHQDQTDASSQTEHGPSTSGGLQDQPQEERGTPPEVAFSEVHEVLVEVRGAPQQVTAAEEPEVSMDKSDANNKDAAPKVPVGRLVSNVICYIEDEIEVLEQDIVDTPKRRRSIEEESFTEKKKKKGVKHFFRGCWKRMKCCFCVSSTD